MHIDAFAKRYFFLIVGALLALAAYFQARGVSALVATAVFDSTEFPPPTGHKRHASTADPDHATSAAPILERNPFDSVTGPILVTGASPSEVRVSSAEQLEPRCKFGRVVILVTSKDPSWSFASVATAGKPATLVREGDEILGFTVRTIEWDRLRFTQGSERCEMALGDKPPLQPSGPPSPAAGPSPGGPRPSGALPPEIAAKIHRISDTEFTVDRSAVQAIIERQAELLSRVRVIPEREGDKVSAVKLSGIRQDSLLAAIGLTNGDALQQLNGFDVGNPQAALEAYAKLQNADRLSLTLKRGGKPMTIDLKIQ